MNESLNRSGEAGNRWGAWSRPDVMSKGADPSRVVPAVIAYPRRFR